MTLIATHDHAVHAIGERLDAATPQQLRSALIAVLTIHINAPSPTLTPDPDCAECQGSGSYFVPEAGGRVHCHCACSFCYGCQAWTCEGPCETVEAIADRLGLLQTGDPT